MLVVLSIAMIPERLSVLADLKANRALEAGPLHVLALHVEPQVGLLQNPGIFSP
jgi:hypothetical protein